MIETLAALIFAHVLADFVLQTNAMVATKGRPLTLAGHGAVVALTLALATGGASPWILALTAAHLGIDAIKTGGTLKRTPALTTTWSRVKSFGALGYYRAVAGQPGQSLSMRFVGTGVTWTFGTGTASGKAHVYIDGVKKATIDQYSSSTRNRVTWSITGLAAGAHTIKIVPTGTKRAASKGTAVSVDALTVR